MASLDWRFVASALGKRRVGSSLTAYPPHVRRGMARVGMDDLERGSCMARRWWFSVLVVAFLWLEALPGGRFQHGSWPESSHLWRAWRVG